MVDHPIFCCVSALCAGFLYQICHIMFTGIARSSICSAVPRSRLIHLFSQGSGVYGALGQGGSLNDSPLFQEVPLVSYCEKENAMIKNAPIKVSAGWGHSAVITDKGKLFIFGRPYDFANLMQLSKLSKVSKSFTKYVARSSSALFGNVTSYYPTPSEVASSNNVTDVCCSAGLTLFISNGNVFSFGLNKYMQCGVTNNNEDIYIYEPVHIASIPGRSKSVAAGLQHGLALTEEGVVYAWGKDLHGQLGNGQPSPEGEFGSLPVPVPLGPNGMLRAHQIAAGFGHSAALTEDGAVYVWGRSMSDTLRDASTGESKLAENQYTPRRIDLPDGRKAVNIVSSNFHVVIEASDRTLWILGLEEMERKTVMHPLQVQSDFHTENGERIPQEQLDAEAQAPEAVIRNVNVVLPRGGARLKGSYQRVLVIHPEEQRRWTKANPSGGSGEGVCEGVYEIVLYQGEAFYKEVDLVSQFDGKWCGVGPVVDFCRGWQHSLIATSLRDTL